MKKKLYLANAYGFSNQTKILLSQFLKVFNDLNIEVYEPFEKTENLLKDNGNWAFDLAKTNYVELKKSEGVMIELGIAIALKKKIFLFRDDFRNCSDSNQYPLNLMLFLGLPKDDWHQFYFENLNDITSNKKNFIQWAKS